MINFLLFPKHVSYSLPSYR